LNRTPICADCSPNCRTAELPNCRTAELPKAKTVEDFEALLPFNASPI
jgi:hypothetical protein